MLSHGASSFLVFSIAFGIILSISRMVRVKMKRKERDAQPILVREEERPRDEVHDTISDLNDFQDTI
jgi:cell division protein FtsW